LWNERDPILKERLFGLTNAEGNHGEDVKEYYFYVDNLPTHSYQRWLYKYPQAEFPYADLAAVNRGRSREEMEYELIDTGVFDDRDYFDVEVEHAKAGPEDIVCRIRVHNRSSEVAALHVLPTLWFRNTWSWLGDEPKPRLARVHSADPVVRAEHDQLGVFYLHAERGAELLFCENETNAARVWGTESATRIAKDGIEYKLRRILARMLDEERFLGPHGIRSISRWHLDHPYSFDVAGVEHRVQYEAAESTSGMFGGNSNWRGPVWFPINLLLIRALFQHYRYYGNDLKVECPTGSGTMMNAVRSGPRALASPRRDLSAGQRRAAPRLRRDQTISGGPALA
jgi:hypothetical protein